MRFERLLARRYIKEQKRHSALTICSIALALTLMTMLFTCYGTFMKCLRNTSYELEPYHMKFLSITDEQYSVLEKEETVEQIIKKDGWNEDVSAEILFKKRSITDYLQYCESLSEKLSMPNTAISSMIDNESVIVNRTLMNLDLIDDTARFTTLRYFCMFFVFILVIAFALRMIIDTAFEISSKEREKQFGILQSIGASPKQIVRIITAEGLFLSVIGIPVGMTCGVGVAYLVYKAVLSSGIAEAFLSSDKAEELIRFSVSPLMLLISALTGLAWVLFSAYGTGMRVIKMSPVEAIHSRKNNIVKVKKHSIFGLLFGWAGKLASRNAHRQPKRFVITIISLTFSIFLYSGMGSTIAAFREFYEDMLNSEVVYDFDTSLTTDCTDPFSYKPILEEVENIGLIDVYMNQSFFIKDGNKSSTILYLNRYGYEEFFGENPPVSYDELTQKGEYILGMYNKTPDKSIKSADLSVTVYELDKSNDEYKEFAYSYSDLIKNYSVKSDKQINIKVADSLNLGENQYIDDEHFFYYGTLDMYESGEYEMFGDITPNVYMGCYLKDNSMYNDALQFIKSNDSIELIYDYYEFKRDIQTQSSAIQIGAGFITLLISLISIVNMINIISTGIINRKSETASMQCVGMTEGQLYKMTFVECLQYVIVASVIALILGALTVYGTMMFMNAVQIISEETQKVIVSLLKDIALRIVQGTLVALFVTVISSFLPLRKMQKTSLIERVKSFD